MWRGPRRGWRGRHVVALTAAACLGFAALAVPASADVPSTPDPPVITAGDALVTAVFTPPFDGGSTITNFLVQCTSSDGGASGSANGTDSPIVVGSLTNGATYTCTLLASNGDGDSQVSDASNAVMPSTQPGTPAAPTISAGDAQISVAFSPPDDGGSAITLYHASCTSNDGGVSATDTGTGSPILVGPVSNGNTYRCTVLASNANGDGPQSAASNSDVPSGVPNAPAAPHINASDAQISVAFSAPFNGGSTITSYHASCTSSNGGASGSKNGSGSPLLVTSLTNGRSYTCTVSASNANGAGPASPASNTDSPGGVPDAPAAPTATPADAQISVAFSAPFNGGSAITRYHASCTSRDGGAGGSKNGGGSPIVVTGLTNGNTYRCTVLATNDNGDGPQSAASNAVVPNTTPDAPVATSTPGNAQISVAFAAPFNGGSTITSYHASCTSSNGGASGTNNGASSPIVVTGLTNGRTYRCTLLATNDNGNSPLSAPSNAVIPREVPATPAAPTVSVADAQISVSFTAPDDGGSAISSFTATCTSSNGGAPGTHAGAGSPIVVGSLTDGKTYTCTVIATNDAGDSLASAPSRAVIPDTLPGAPAAPAVVAGNAQISVSFTAPTDAGSAITSYRASCTSSNGGVARTNSQPASPIVVSGLSNGRTYTCRVAAFNAGGAGPSSPASAPTVPTSVPSAPARPGAVAGNAQVSVGFTRPFDGGRTISSYRATCSSRNGGASRSRTGAHSPIVVTGLSNGKTYTCTVAATNADGTGPPSGASAAVVPAVPVPVARGFRLYSGDGGVFTFGNEQFYGSAAGVSIQTVICMATTPDNRGYWLVAADGGVFTFGDAHFYGSAAGISRLPVVGCAATPSGRGYWLVASDGGIFAFGDALFRGSTGAIKLVQPIVAMASTPSGRGYWTVAADGGVFSFGDAPFAGSAAGRTAQHIIGIAATGTGHGYWIAGDGGEVFAFGDARALGSVPSLRLRLPVMGIQSTPSGHGYWLAAGDGGVFTFGDAPFYGWPGPLVLRRIIRGIGR